MSSVVQVLANMKQMTNVTTNDDVTLQLIWS